MMTLVIHHPAVRTLNVDKRTDKPFARVWLGLMEHLHIANLNAFKIQTVPQA